MNHMAVTDRDANLLGAFALLVNDAVRERTSAVIGHTGADTAALTVLAQEPGLTIEGLRVPLGLSQSATVRLVDRLVHDGHAYRAAGRDGRSVSVRLTEAGHARARTLLAARADVLGAATAVLTERERAQLSTMLTKMLAALTTDAAHAERVCRLCDLDACERATCPVDQAGRQCAATEPER